MQDTSFLLDLGKFMAQKNKNLSPDQTRRFATLKIGQLFLYRGKTTELLRKRTKEASEVRLIFENHSCSKITGPTNA